MKNLFTKKIIAWYQNNQRQLPWRHTTDPYKIWLSEIILQQTRVVQGLPYYLKFIENFPDVYSLAQADENTVLKLWQGLGYYSRARNLHYTAQIIVSKYNGQFPKTYKELLQLKGIGDYTAAAIASFAYKETVPVVDGNVYRVLSRYFGITTPIDSTRAKKEFKNLASQLIEPSQPDVFNQALMEFGAVQCLPQSPNCGACTLQDSCLALQQKKVHILPIKSKKLSIRKRYFDYLIFQFTNHQTIIHKRISKDIWQHLYEFPLIENDQPIHYDAFLEQLYQNKFIDTPTFELKKINHIPIVHKLTHQELVINFWEIKMQSISENTVSWDYALQQPFPIIIYQFLRTYLKV